MAASPWALKVPLRPTRDRLLASDEDMLTPEEQQSQLDEAAMAGQIQPNPVAMAEQPQPSPVSMGTAPTARSMYDALGAVGNKGARIETTRSDTSTTRRSANRFLTKTPEQTRAEYMMGSGVTPGITGYEPAYDSKGNVVFGANGKQIFDQDRPIYDLEHTTTDPNHPVQQQMAGLARMDDLLRMEADSNAKRSTLDLRPLAALADARANEMGKPSNITAGMAAPEDRSKQFTAMADEIQKRRADVQKAIAENVKNLKGGSTLDQYTQALLARDMAGQNNTGFDRMGAQDKRIDASAHAAMLRRINTDKNLRDRLVQYQNLSNGLKTLFEAKHLTPQAFLTIQKDIRSNLGIKGTSGVTEREEDMIRDLGYNVESIKQMLSGDLANLNPDDPKIQHVKELAEREMGNIQEQFRAQLEAAGEGNASMYERRKDLAADRDKAIRAQMKKLSSTGNTAAPPSPGATPSPGPSSSNPNYKGPTIEQNGHTFTWNEKLGSYE